MHFRISLSGALRWRTALALVLLGPALSACAQSTPAAPPPLASEPTIVQVQSPLGAYLASTSAATAGDYAAAADLSTQALADDPENLDLMRRAFVFSTGEGRMEQAVQLARRLTARDPSFPLAQIVLAFEDVGSGHREDAEKRIAALPRSGVNNLLLPVVGAWIAASQNKWEAAEQSLRPLADISPLAGLFDYHTALIAARRGDKAGLEAAIESLLKADETPPLRIVELAGAFYENTQRPEKAKALYDVYQARNPDTLYLTNAYRRIADKAPPPRLALTDKEGLAEALFDVATLIQRERQGNETALIYTRIVLSLRPDFPAAQMLLAEILETQNREAAAIKTYQSIGPDSPFRWVARLRVAGNRDALGDTEGALADLKQMALERPERDDALGYAGDLLRQHSRFAEAVILYDSAFGRIPKIERRHASLLFNRAIALERSGQVDRAIEDLQRALSLEPDQPYILNYLGYTWVDQGKNLEQGRRMLEKAVELRPRDGAIVDSLGWAFYRLGDLPRAVRWLERAVELKPGDPTINDHLGDAYWRTGRKREAGFQWERSLKLNPEPKDREQTERKLKEGLPTP
ncbi:tetratricopeptide repeat protein [Elstera sp.]|jgi:tetratricopeptide (TPR) repeat protein|uniref:tetratricopeptide repeat protein n=1 Tax=Elstera sp. TaxID=1916664 RepID=UPI0037C0DC78